MAKDDDEFDDENDPDVLAAILEFPVHEEPAESGTPIRRVAPGGLLTKFRAHCRGAQVQPNGELSLVFTVDSRDRQRAIEISNYFGYTLEVAVRRQRIAEEEADG